ncbi:MAG: acetoacetate--CoA ligase, partial [Thermodesulfobacteriota bacterium]
LAQGVQLDDALVKKIKTVIRDQCSPRHMPAKIIPVTDIPVTLNNKKVEIAVRNMIEGKPVTNRDALANPEALEQFANVPALQT